MADDAPEGIVLSSRGLSNVFIDLDDIYGTSLMDVTILSKNQLETLDVLSEGIIEGLATGEYIKSGAVGEIGWRTAIFSGYTTPVGYENLQSLRSVYWNEVPVLSDIGQFNFQNVSIAQTPGYPNGEAIQVLSPFQTVSRTIGERLRGGFTPDDQQHSKYYRISNRDCRGVVVNIKIPQLYRVVEDTAKVVRTEVKYVIGYRAFFSNKASSDFVVAKTSSVFGKISAAGGYIRADRIDFPSNLLEDKAFMGWEIKITRPTPDSTSTNLVNATYVDSITEIQGNVYTFPNSALARSLFDAEYFASVPERAYDTNLLKVKIPGNYNPVLKTYSGVGFATTNGGWNGEFATGKHWTDNPAWCYYDLLTNRRYGLGRYIDSLIVDPTSLYDIGKYCDTLVSDGYGGLEPRFTCNLWLTSREEAYKVVNDMASIFLGMTYYANGSIYVSQDAPKSPIVTFTNANVENGNFNYSTTSKKTRNSVAIVRFNDPKNFYRPSVEYVDDVEMIRKYGIREVETTAFGCSSRGQAMRMGRWILLSDKLEPESIDFVAGIGEAAYLRPGDVFKVHDSNKKLKRYGGRTVSVVNVAGTGSTVVLDSRLDVEPTVEYKLSFVTPSFNYNSSQVSGYTSSDSSNIRKSFIQEFYFSGFQTLLTGNRTKVDLYSGFDYVNYKVTGQQVWMMELSDRYSTYTGNFYFANNTEDYYRVINIDEKETNKFNIVGMQYNQQKYAEIESGISFQAQRTNTINVPSSPSNLNIDVFLRTPVEREISYGFVVDSAASVDQYKVYVKNDPFVGNGVPDQRYLQNTLPATSPYGKYRVGARGVDDTGNFHFRVYSFNSKQGVLSNNFASGVATIYEAEPIRDTIISNLHVVNSTGIYSGSSTNGIVKVISENNLNPKFAWSVGSNNLYATTGLYWYMVTIRSNPNGSRIPSPTVVRRESGIIPTNWTFTFDRNIGCSGGPYRDYQVVVEGYSPDGKTSAGNQIGSTETSSWTAYPNGYDIIEISNPRQTGIELSNNIPTRPYIGGGVGFSGITGRHQTTQYMTVNGGIAIDFISGSFDSDLVGGFIYVSSGRFPKQETAMRSGEWNTAVRRSAFSFYPNYPTIHHPTAAVDFRGATRSYISLSFFDAVDAEFVKQGKDITTGLYMSNNAICESNSYAQSINLGGAAAVYSVRVPGVASSEADTLITNAIPANGKFIAYSTLAAGGGSTAILYMGPPLTGSPYTGTYGGEPVRIS